MNQTGGIRRDFLRRWFPWLLSWCVLAQARGSFAASANLANTLTYNSRMWQTDEGLPQNVAQALAQTPEGYLWVGTQNGLTRFDGAQFKVYDPKNTPALAGSSVTSLCLGKNGSLWIGMAPGGLAELRDGIFYAHPLAKDYKGNSIKTLYEDKAGVLWIGTLGGIFRFENGAATRFTKKDGLCDDVVRSFCEWKGDLWIGTGSGLNIYKNGRILNQTNLPNRSVRAILSDSQGNFWAGWTSGLECLKKDGKLISYSKSDGLADNNVCSLFEDKRGTLWIGTFGGLSRIVGGKISTETDEKGIFYDQVNALMEDREGDLWMGTKDGLHELRIKRFTTYTRQQGLPHNNIMSVLEDKKGDMWVGTWGGGISRLRGNKVMSYGIENGREFGLVTDLILSLFADTDGSIWAGCDYEAGIFRFENGRWSRVMSAEQSQLDRVIRVIYRDRENNLWFGAGPGLILWNSNTNIMPKSVVRCLWEDHEGTLWIGSNDGVFQRKNGIVTKWSGKGELAHGAIMAFYEDADQALWIGTEKNGLLRYQAGRLSIYTTKQGLHTDEVSGILEDDYGWLWISSSKGIYRISKKNLQELDQKKTARLTCIVYGKADGMESIQCSEIAQPSNCKGSDGRLWFATAKGLVSTDPRVSLDYNERPPVVLVEQVIADDHVFPATDLPSGKTNNAAGPLQIEPGNGNLQFEFTALSLQQADQNRFKYKLEGVDADWVAGNRRVAIYNNVPPGKYRFRVIACNNDGVWNETGASVALILRPHFWQTWWFSGSITLGLLVLGAGIVRQTTNRKMQHELQRLEKQHAVEEERIRIARDMHDEIGAKLTKISFLGAMARRKLAVPEEAGPQIDKMSVTAREVIRALDEIVWAVNPANDSVEHLATYLCRNATEFFESSPILCQFKIPAELPAYRLGTNVRHNVLLAAKEAMNNVLKHSGATNVQVQISVASEIFEVTISDNGRGLNGKPQSLSDATISGRVGSGMTNMVERLKSIGGRCEVKSQPKEGVSVILTVILKGRVIENGKN